MGMGEGVAVGHRPWVAPSPGFWMPSGKHGGLRREVKPQPGTSCTRPTPVPRNGKLAAH